MRLNLKQFRAYLDRLSNPLNEQQKKSTFWSRSVRDNARALVDALTMEQEGVPDEMIRLLTRSYDVPDGVDLNAFYAAFGEKRG